jgi:hypothetical protein
VSSILETELVTNEQYRRRTEAFRWATTALKVVIVVLAMKAVLSGPEVWFYSGIFTAGFTLVPTLLRRALDISIPYFLEFLLFLALLLHVGGGALGLYDMFWTWDLVTHFVSTFMLAFIGIILVVLVNSHMDLFEMTPARIFMVTMVIAMSLGLLWEGMEWAADRLFDIRAQDGLADTLLDLVMDAVGGVAAALLAVRWHRDGTIQRTTSEFGEGVDRFFDRFTSLSGVPVSQ